MPQANKLPSILVVDDEADICQNLSDILQDFGYDVDTCLNGEAALAMIRKKPYDVALLDLKMPGMDGLTLYHHIREDRSDTVAIIVTAYATPQTTEEALKSGAWQVLQKPVDFSRLLSLVEGAVNQPLVMLVDDDKDLCSNLWDMLRDRGYRVCVAHSEQEAAQLLNDRDYQIVLVDLMLPGGDGNTVLNLIHERHPEARTVLITGHPEALNRELADLKTDAVCYKPFDIPGLLQTIDRLAKANK